MDKPTLESRLADEVYRPTALPSLLPSTRLKAVLLSLPVYAAVGAATAWGGRQVKHVEVRTVLVSLQEIAGDGSGGTPAPPPPPPPGGGGPVATSPSSPPREADLPEQTPSRMPDPGPLSIPGTPGTGSPGLPGGQPGGVAGGTPGGKVGGLLGSTGTGGGHRVEPVVPPRFDAAYLKNPQPDYPSPSRRLREAGQVVLKVLVSPEGRVERLELHASSGFPRLDQAATLAVRHWTFVPARRGTEPVSAWVLVPLTFTLDA